MSAIFNLTVTTPTNGAVAITPTKFLISKSSDHTHTATQQEQKPGQVFVEAPRTHSGTQSGSQSGPVPVSVVTTSTGISTETTPPNNFAGYNVYEEGLKPKLEQIPRMSLSDDEIESPVKESIEFQEDDILAQV